MQSKTEAMYIVESYQMFSPNITKYEFYENRQLCSRINPHQCPKDAAMFTPEDQVSNITEQNTVT